MNHEVLKQWSSKPNRNFTWDEFSIAVYWFFSTLKSDVLRGNNSPIGFVTPFIHHGIQFWSKMLRDKRMKMKILSQNLFKVPNPYRRSRLLVVPLPSEWISFISSVARFFSDFIERGVSSYRSGEKSKWLKPKLKSMIKIGYLRE
jgi:hypothetical protein